MGNIGKEGYPVLSFQTATVNGILQGGIQPIEPNCPTGNCTWPSTPSLAVCGECVPSTYTSSCERLGICNITSASGQTMQITPEIFYIISGNGSHFPQNDTTRAYIANFDLLGHNQTATLHPHFQGLWDNALSSSECALWFCVQMYDASDDCEPVLTVDRVYSVEDLRHRSCTQCDHRQLC